MRKSTNPAIALRNGSLRRTERFREPHRQGCARHGRRPATGCTAQFHMAADTGGRLLAGDLSAAPVLLAGMRGTIRTLNPLSNRLQV